MQISGIQSTQQTANVNNRQSSDPVIKNAQNQIAELQKRLQALAEDGETDAKTKADKKKEIQQQIADLNTQIRQRQAEMRKQQQEPKENYKKKAEREAEQKQAKAGAFTARGTQALISAENSVKQSDTLGAVVTDLEGKERILKRQIATDAARGADTSAKQTELSKIKEHISGAKEDQAEVLGEANKTLKAAAEYDKEERKAEKSKEKDEEKESEKSGETEEKKIKTEGIYDKDGNWVEEEDDEGKDYEDRA